MEFRIDKQTFLNGLYKVQGIIDKKSSLNVLSHVLITSEGDRIRMTSTDYDVVLFCTNGAEILQQGSMAVNGRSLFDVVKTLPNAQVHLKALENHWVEVSCGRSRFRLTGIPSEDFPKFQDDAGIPMFAVDKAVIQSMIDKTSFSVSTDETRPNLNGVFFQVQPDGNGRIRMVMVSTDGHRLSKVEETIDSDWSGAGSEAIIHKKGVFELKRILDGVDEQTQIGFHQANVVFRNDGNTMFVRQIEEAFPDYTKVIPTSNHVSVNINKDAMLEAVRRIGILTSSKTSVIRMEITPEKLILVSSNPEAGEGRDEIDIDYGGEPLAVGFNYRYLLDVLGAIEGGVIQFEINDQFSPGVIRSEEDPNAVFVIMPMRI